jgi:hypothetical protein
MNYIPGFSNYLQASVPRYAKGGPARFVEDVMYLDNGDYGSEPYAAPYMPAAEPSYIPGFSNYLEASVPPYAEPAQYMPAAQPMTQEAAAPYVEPYQSMPAAQPMTQEAAPFDLSSLAGLDLSGLGGFGGGRMGGVIQDPNIQYITAPISNKGNPTGRMGGNVFAVTPDQPVRLVDLRTNTIVFEGTGVDAAREATRLGQSMTDSLGRKASYDIQTADPSGAYITVANEKKNSSTLGTLGKIVGTALPVVVSLVPGLQFAGPVLSAAIAGGAGAAMAGRDPIKGAVMGGLSAAGGQVLGPALQGAGVGAKAATALGTGLGSTAGGLATGQSLKSSLLGGVASGALSYVAPSIQDELGISTKSGSIFQGDGPSASSSTSADGYDGILVNATPASAPSASAPSSIGYTLGGSPNKIQQALAEKPYDGITAIGNRLGNTFGSVNLGGNQFGAPGEGPSALDKLTQPEPTEGVEEIDVFGNKIIRATPVSVPATGVLSSDIVVNAPKAVSKEDGLPEGSVVGGLPITGLPTPDPALTGEGDKKLGLEEYLRLAGLASGLIGGGGGGSGSSGTYGGAGGTGRLNPIFSAKLPPAGGLGSIGMNRTARPMGDVDWLTYGTRPELSFFDYAPAMPAPVTTPVPGNPAGPIMAERDPTRFAKGGRSEFAVNGAGTGRSDDIPAVLSDGEYVIDAETVALLGDGSNKAGAKKLDELRIKVRKHKGRKLAKGRFSANAKRPEAYLSGGRI